jgi:hypothetical protein
MARKIQLADNWEYCYDHEEVMTTEWRTAGVHISTHSNLIESINYGFYMSPEAPFEPFYPGNGYSLPGTIISANWNSVTQNWYPHPSVIGGHFYCDHVNTGFYDQYGLVRYNVVENFDPTTTYEPTMWHRNPAAFYRTVATSPVGAPYPQNGYQIYQPQGPISVYFWDFMDNQQWASGCMGVIGAGSRDGDTGSQILALDILAPNGDILKTFDVHFRSAVLGIPPDVNLGDGEFVSRWVPPPGDDLGLIDGSYGTEMSPVGGTIRFTYTGKCAGFRVRKAGDINDPWYFLYTTPIDFFLYGWGKRVLSTPPLRWNQRNDGRGIIAPSAQISPSGAGTSSSIGTSNRLPIGQNIYE